MWAAGSALALALRAHALRRLPQCAPAQNLATALSPPTLTLSEVSGARRLGAAAGGGATRPPPGDGPGNGLRGAGWAKTVDSEAAQAGPPERRAGNAAKRFAGPPAQPEPPKRKLAPRVGVLGEKTAGGRPKPDERTVADLVRRGWFVSEEEAVALLTRAKSRKERYPFKTAEPAADWLEATLGPEPVTDGLCPAATVVKREPVLLASDASTLQRKWEALTLSTERGGVGIALPTEQARKAVCKHPQLLGYSVETYKTGWSMLTATANGLSLPPDEARKCILRVPAVLRYNYNSVVQRIALLKSRGYPDARAMVLANSTVLNFKEETVKEHAAWWKQCGLDHMKLVTAHPTLLGVCSVQELQVKLGFFRQAGLSNEDLDKAGALFTYSLDGRLRARYFYALQKHQIGGRFGIFTLMSLTDAAFVAVMQGGTKRDRTSKAEVARYRKLVTSAGFVAWRERQEARLMRLDR